MPQIMVRQRAGKHGFADGHGTDPDAGVVTTLGADLHLIAVGVDAAAFVQD